jgi:hypothetical protein
MTPPELKDGWYFVYPDGEMEYLSFWRLIAVDISFITAFHARFVLDAIARKLVERPKFLTLLKENYIVWGNRPVHPFNKDFQLQRIELPQQESCAVCAGRIANHVHV